MKTIEIGLLFILLFLACLGAYWVGRKKNLALVRGIGKNGAVLSFLVMLISAILIFVRRGAD